MPLAQRGGPCCAGADREDEQSACTGTFMRDPFAEAKDRPPQKPVVDGGTSNIRK